MREESETMSGEFVTRRTCLIVGAAGALLATAGASAAFAQNNAIQSQDTDVGGVVAEITECKRKGDVLTIKMRIVNNSGSKTRVTIIKDNDYDNFYLISGDKKYFVLRDSEGVPVATPSRNTYFEPEIEKGGTANFWAKYPSPPPEVKEITFYTRITAPFEDLPITE